jgi:hypothetical protein
MEILGLTVLVLAYWTLRRQDQGRRIALLGRHLGHYQIEKHMETLTQGYLRALGESDPGRRAQVWQLLQATEQALAGQFSRFAQEFARAGAAETRTSTLAFYVPFADRLLARATFDAREAMAIHARGIANAARNSAQAPSRNTAFTMSAELFLMQHSCHWFCKSRPVASARMLARHKTSHQQLVDAVAPDTRAAYRALTGV